MMREINLDMKTIQAESRNIIKNAGWCQIIIDKGPTEIVINLWGNPGACEALAHAINTEFHPVPEEVG